MAANHKCTFEVLKHKGQTTKTKTCKSFNFFYILCISTNAQISFLPTYHCFAEQHLRHISTWCKQCTVRFCCIKVSSTQGTSLTTDRRETTKKFMRVSIYSVSAQLYHPSPCPRWSACHSPCSIQSFVLLLGTLHTATVVELKSAAARQLLKVSLCRLRA